MAWPRTGFPLAAAALGALLGTYVCSPPGGDS